MALLKSKQVLILVVILLAIAGFSTACSSVKYASEQSGKTEEKEGAALVSVKDEYAELDDASSFSPGNDHIVTLKLENARQKYLRALTFIDRGDTINAARSFEESIDILNTLVNYPNIEQNADFTDLMQSIIEDYESYIQSVDDLDENSSIFILREKFLQEIDASVTAQSKNSVSTIRVPKATTGIAAVTGMKGELQIPMTDNEYVDNCIKFFTQNKGQKFFQKWLPRSGRWFPMMRQIAKEEGVPEEMIYLSMIESGLDPNAVSRAKAVGMWQFMKSTGELYGLKVNYWVDERRDPEKSTRAAMRHMRDLYSEFGDWHLVMAGYNYGLGGVRRTIARSGKEKPNYWDIRDLLPKETRNYVPGYIAVAKLSMNPEGYGFTDVDFNPQYAYETVTLSEAVDLSVLAKCANTTPEIIHSLNPELIQGCIPPNISNYVLKIPVGSKSVFAANYAQMPDEAKRSWVLHTVKKNETLADIADQYGSSAQLIAEANNLSGKAKRLHNGTVLRVPLSGSKPDGEKTEEIADNQETPSKADPVKSDAKSESPATGKKIVHKVRRSETLHSIANRYGVRITDLRNWNNMPYDEENIKVNSTLVLYVDKQSEKQEEPKEIAHIATLKMVKHKVRRGETAATIADDYNISLADLRKYNTLGKKNTVMVGQILKVPSSKETKEASRIAAVDRSHAKSFTIHKVKKGETLGEIASLYGVETREVAEWNPATVKHNTVFSGARLKIYGQMEAKGSASSTRSSSVPKTYKIRKGDTLGEIAQKFGVSVSHLKKLNKNLDETTLAIGKSVRVQ